MIYKFQFDKTHYAYRLDKYYITDFKTSKL